MQAKIRKIGNSDGTIIPSALLKKLNLKTGDKISIEEAQGQIVITTTKPKYKLAELLAKCDLTAPMPEEVAEWDNTKPVGNELW